MYICTLLYFVLIYTEDDRSFCRNMFLKCRVVSENIVMSATIQTRTDSFVHMTTKIC